MFQAEAMIMEKIKFTRIFNFWFLPFLVGVSLSSGYFVTHKLFIKMSNSSKSDENEFELRKTELTLIPLQAKNRIDNKKSKEKDFVSNGNANSISNDQIKNNPILLEEKQKQATSTRTNLKASQLLSGYNSKELSPKLITISMPNNLSVNPSNKKTSEEEILFKTLFETLPQP